MKITVVGASGLIGAKVVEQLRGQGHEVVAASRSTGVDVVTGEGLTDAWSGIPRSIVRATQFAEFTGAITESLTVGDEVRVPDALIQPIPADEVAAAVAGAASGEPINGIVNIGGPMKITFEQMARDSLARKGDEALPVIVDPEARYFGALLEMRSLVTPD